MMGRRLRELVTEFIWVPEELLYKEEVYQIIGCAMEVHRALGCGFFEAVYQEALEIEFSSRGIPNVREKELNILYKGQCLKKSYIADFVCFDKIIVELKALNELQDMHYAQLLNYLKASGYRLGLLLNFGELSLHYKRIIL